MSFDKDFENRIRAILGDEFDDFITALEKDRTNAIRINTLKHHKTDSVTNKKQYAEGESISDMKHRIKDILSADGTIFSGDIAWEDRGVVYKEGTPGKHPLHEAGAYYIQEPSAMSPVSFLDPKPGEKILDLCAAPGGKSTQIASRMNGEGILVSNEIDRKRAQVLSLNIERCGIKNALVTNMKPEALSEIFEGYFDKILVDAPCSGEGMFRKLEEAVSNWSTDNVKLCSGRQTDILSEAVKMLAPGGRLVYSTCTFAPEEDELQVAKLLLHGLKPAHISLYDGMVSGDLNNLKKIEPFLPEDSTDLSFIESINDNVANDIKKCSGRLWPHKVEGEGHFFAVFEKEGDISLNEGLYSINGKPRGLKDDEILLLKEFTGEFLKNVSVSSDLNSTRKDGKPDKKKAKDRKVLKGSKNICRLEGDLSGIPFMFGEQLYLAPEGMPGISGLTVLRAGLHLGTIKNGRFVPSHSLALAISPDMAVYTYELENSEEPLQNGDSLSYAGYPRSMQFIGGNSFKEASLKKGWYLITAFGYSLGWAKFAGGTLKNHYPKGLRIYT